MDPGFSLSIEDIYAARQRIQDVVVRTPIVRLNLPDAPGEIYLKLENLQPVGSFKLRGAANAMLSNNRDKKSRQGAVWTPSAGNMGQAVSWVAQRMDVQCTVLAPNDASQTKLNAIARLGAHIVQVPFPDYQQIQRQHAFCRDKDIRSLASPLLPPELEGQLVHPFADWDVMTGNATIALEILEDLPDVDVVLASYGGGGLSCGIAYALRALRPQARVYACEVDTGAPLAASLAAGKQVEVNYSPSFVSGMGAPYVFPAMWPLACRLLAGSLVVTLTQVASAIRLLIEYNRIIAEGAGAVPVAAALAGLAGECKIVCVISGGNIDMDKLVNILGR